jgi:hypothetical protein
MNPVIKEATKYITRYQKAKPIEAGLEWCQLWLQSGCSAGQDWRQMTPQQTVDSLIHRLHVEGVDPIKVMATLTAYFYLDKHRPGTFRSDAHFRHQMVKSLLSLTALPVVKVVPVSGYQERKVFLELSPKVIVKGYATIRMDALILAVKIAEKLHESDHWQHNILGRMAYPIPNHQPQEGATQEA